MNKAALGVLGVSSSLLEDILYTMGGGEGVLRNTIPHHSARQTVIMSMFLNSHGLVHGRDMVKCIQSFHTEAGSKEEGGCQKLLSVKDREGYDAVLHGMSKEDILTMCKRARSNHSSNTTVQKITQTSYEEVGHIVSDIVKSPCVNIENIINEVVSQSVQPDYLERQFLRAVDGWKEITEEDHSSRTFVSSLSNFVVDLLDGRGNELRHDLFQLVLPTRYHLPGIENTSVLDIISNVLLGANAPEMKSFYDIITFARIAQVKSSSAMLKLIDGQERVIRNGGESDVIYDVEDHWSVPGNNGLQLLTHGARLEWGRQMYFIVFLELVRQIVPKFAYMKVGCLTSCNVPGDYIKHSPMEVGTRCIPENTVYYSRGYYFCKWRGKGFCSSSYKTLLSKGNDILDEK